MSKDEALKRALEALKEILTNDGGEGSKCYSAIRLYDARILGGEAIKALEEALANHCEDNLDMVKQEQGEPVAWALEWTFDGEEKGIRLYDDETHCRLDAENGGGVCRSLVYSDTTPQQRKWVGLTDEEINDCIKFPNRNLFARDGTTSQRIARATEAKLKERNHGT